MSLLLTLHVIDVNMDDKVPLVVFMGINTDWWYPPSWHLDSIKSQKLRIAKLQYTTPF